MTRDELFLLTDADIEYDELSDETLKELALGDDLFVATSALTKLSIRESKMAGETAWKILSEALGDKFLQALALRVIFDTDKSLFFDYIKNKLQQLEPCSLSTVLELALENQDDFNSDVSGTAIIGKLLKLLEQAEKAIEFSDVEVKNNFVKTFQQTLPSEAAIVKQITVN